MAITGSGSLAISLSVFVISAAFLPKGEFPKFLSSRVRHGRVAAFAGVAQSRRGDGCRGGEVVARLRAATRASFAWNRGITFPAPLWTLRGLVAVSNAGFSGVVVTSSGRGDSGKK